MKDYFGDLIVESKRLFESDKKAWLGASPVTKADKKSFNSPSIDSLLIKYG
jgi:hypothetical protein